MSKSPNGQNSLVLAYFGNDNFGLRLTYKIAAQIYEALDAGFTSSEIIELLGTRKKYVEKCIAKRPKFEPKIISALKALYPAQKFDKPYLTSHN
jgi:hypothetical protein